MKLRKKLTYPYFVFLKFQVYKIKLKKIYIQIISYFLNFEYEKKQKNFTYQIFHVFKFSSM